MIGTSNVQSIYESASEVSIACACALKEACVQAITLV